MRLRRRVGDQLSVATTLIAGEIGCAFPRREQCTKRSARRRVLDHAASGIRRKELPRQVEHCNQPIENMRFQFGGGGGWSPKASPARPVPRKANRQELPVPKRWLERKQKNSVIANA